MYETWWAGKDLFYGELAGDTWRGNLEAWRGGNELGGTKGDEEKLWNRESEQAMKEAFEMGEILIL